MADQKTTLNLLQELDGDLTKMADNFGKLVRASKLRTEASVSADHVPGDLFPVLVEKLVHRSELALQRVRELRMYLTLHNVGAVLGKAKKSAARLESFKHQTEVAVLRGRSVAVTRLKTLLLALETHYYGAGPHVEDAEAQPLDAELQELCAQALNAPFE